jgi:hypothetical protein
MDTVITRDLGTFRLKGVENPQQVFELAPKNWVVRNFPNPTPQASGIKREGTRLKFI